MAALYRPDKTRRGWNAVSIHRLTTFAASRKEPPGEVADVPGESGTFKLRRKTPANLTAEVTLDVGTWSHSVSGFFSVNGVGFKGTLILPVSASEVIGTQYPIGDAARWQKIVENLGALVAELERTFVPEIEQAGGPAPEWYEPER
jgi:hypothetical protein